MTKFSSSLPHLEAVMIEWNSGVVTLTENGPPEIVCATVINPQVNSTQSVSLQVLTEDSTAHGK